VAATRAALGLGLADAFVCAVWTATLTRVPQDKLKAARTCESAQAVFGGHMSQLRFVQPCSFHFAKTFWCYHVDRGEGRLLMAAASSKPTQTTNSRTMTASSPSPPSGLELLVEASMMRTPPTIPEATTPKQAVHIPPLPPAPKKVQFAMSRTAVMPSFPTLTFDVGGDAKPMWLRLNPRANPKSKTRCFEPRSAKQRSSTSFGQSIGTTCSRRG